MVARKKSEVEKYFEGTRKFLFFIFSYLVFTLSLSLIGSIFVTLQRGEHPQGFFDVMTSILKELYFLTPDHAGVWYVMFIILFFFAGYWFYCTNELSRSKKIFDLKAFLSFGMFMPLSTTVLLHVANLVS